MGSSVSRCDGNLQPPPLPNTLHTHTPHPHLKQLRAYAAQEERGFSLYTFVNEAQWRERKALEAEIAALRAEWVRACAFGWLGL